MTDTQDIRTMKRQMTLDFDAAGANSRPKRLRNQLATPGAAGGAVPLLSSPDLKRFVLASPDVEKFIKGGLAVSSSTQPTPVSAYIFPSKNPTSQQAQFAKGFEDALEQVKRRGSQVTMPNTDPPIVTCTSQLTGATTTLTTLTPANLHLLQVQMGAPTASSQSSTLSSAETHNSDTSDSMSTMNIKDEQTVPNGSSVDPIDMRNQERMKLERKRQRNRQAAQKCRKKKIERISQLEDQVNKLKGDNLEYEKMITMLQQEVASLRQEALSHQQSGCLIEL